MKPAKISMVIGSLNLAKSHTQFLNITVVSMEKWKYLIIFINILLFKIKLKPCFKHNENKNLNEPQNTTNSSFCINSKI